MTAAGLGLNRFCYAGLIVAHLNKTPVTDDFATKVMIRFFKNFLHIYAENFAEILKLILLCGKGC